MLTSTVIVVRLVEAPQNFQHWVKLRSLEAWVWSTDQVRFWVDKMAWGQNSMHLSSWRKIEVL